MIATTALTRHVVDVVVAWWKSIAKKSRRTRKGKKTDAGYSSAGVIVINPKTIPIGQKTWPGGFCTSCRQPAIDLMKITPHGAPEGAISVTVLLTHMLSISVLPRTRSQHMLSISVLPRLSACAHPGPFTDPISHTQ